MPGFDRTGPEGNGPMTGRKLGRCNPNAPERTAEADERYLPGRGLAHRRGRGAGRPTRGDGLGRGLARRRGFGRHR
ncbi:MAG: DUF5320 domain-containing protein [Bacteroidales bacterium]